MTRKVIIRGHVFDYAEKAPFVVSGQSVLGALEYDEEVDSIKCHECGGWVHRALGLHLRHTHGLPAHQYRELHGISTTTALITPSKKEERRVALKSSNNTFGSAKWLAKANRVKATLLDTSRNKRTGETQNLSGRCAAQMLFRIQLIAAEYGHTPTAKECASHGLTFQTIKKHFGGMGEAMEVAGLKPRNTGRAAASSSFGLPDGFPSKEDLWKARMPWPKEYFDAGLIALERKQA